MNGFEDVSATKPSKIWDHWLYNKTTGMAKCKVCGKVIKATDDQVTDEMKAALNKLRNENARFTITTDE